MDVPISRYRALGDPVAFSGITGMRRRFRMNEAQAKYLLSTIHSYTRFREAKRPVYNPVVVYNRGELLQADLVEMRNSDENDNVRYLLTCIDTFSRKAFIEPLKTKQQDEVVAAFERILTNLQPRVIRRLLVDRGTEFVNATFKRLMREHGIELIHPNFKAPHVERFQRSLQKLIYNYMEDRQILRYIDKLDSVLHTYNSRFHRMIGMSPNEADRVGNRDRVIHNNRKTLNKVLPKKNVPKFNVGDIVRIIRQKGHFGRSYDHNFTGEVFRIVEIKSRLPRVMYRIESWDKDPVIGWFYFEELQSIPPGMQFPIEAILAYRGTGRNRQAKIKFLYFDKPQWHAAADIV